MKTYISSSNYGNEIELTREQAERGYHSGDCEMDVIELVSEFADQLNKIDREDLKKELKGYGAWTDEQLNDHDENLLRWVWLSCGDVSERLHDGLMEEEI